MSGHCSWRVPMVIALLCIGTGVWSADPSFYAPFDTGTDAAHAVGSAVGSPSTQLALAEGIAGQAVTVGAVGEETLCCTYEAAGNIGVGQGTVSLWVKPLDWDGTVRGSMTNSALAASWVVVNTGAVPPLRPLASRVKADSVPVSSAVITRW